VWKQGTVCAAFPVRIQAGEKLYPAYREVQTVTPEECAKLYVAPRLLGADPPEEHQEFFNQRVNPIAGENTRRLAAVKAEEPEPGAGLF
jgi:hypothetical protein